MMMLVIIYHMLNDDTDFCPNNCEQVIHPPKQKPITLILENTFQFLSEQGTDEPIVLQLNQQLSASHLFFLKYSIVIFYNLAQ